MASSSRQPRKWTPAEDQKLREEVEAQILASGDVKDWCKIADELPGRTNKDCRKRWHNSVQGGLKKGQWSKSEDLLLARGVQQYGQRWTLVANCVESRSADQCAKRWQQSLDPDLDRSEWREEEDQILINATQELGRHWKDIQREYFPGRSKNCIKNRYTVLVRRYQNQGITLSSPPRSPSEVNTPLAASPYHEDEEEYPSYTQDMYGHLMPPQGSGTSGGSHRSWPSYDSQATSWSASYSIPASAAHYTQEPESLPDYPFAQPQFESHTAVASGSGWSNWTSHDVTTSSLHARSPVPYYSAPHHTPHYDDYSQQRPVMSSPRSSSYSTSSGRANYHNMANPMATNVARSSSWPEQQHYHSLPPADYEDPRLQHNPSYRY